jgi:hypothetical protein
MSDLEEAIQETFGLIEKLQAEIQIEILKTRICRASLQQIAIVTGTSTEAHKIAIETLEQTK